MNKLALSILFASSLLFSGCTVHHYHHDKAPSRVRVERRIMKQGHPQMGMKGHGAKGMKGHGAKGHGMKGHGMKGHGAKGHHGEQCQGHHGKGANELPAGHPPLEGHAAGHHGSKGHGAGHEAGHEMKKMPAEIMAFHDSFGAAWHLETDDARRTAACAQVGEWKKLTQAVKKLQGGPVFAAATKDLHLKTAAVGGVCNRKNGDVQAALVSAHDALHLLYKVTPEQKPAAAAVP